MAAGMSGLMPLPIELPGWTPGVSAGLGMGGQTIAEVIAQMRWSFTRRNCYIMGHLKKQLQPKQTKINFA